jgi:hypothetical protein
VRLTSFLVVTALLVVACKRDGIEKPELPSLSAVPPGAHDVARVQYNDTNDIYRVYLASAAAGTEPLRLRGVRLALLSEEQIAAGKKPHLKDDGAGPVITAGPRFKIGVIHGIVEERINDGKRKNVVVRAERKSWSPFVVPKLVDGKSVWLVPAVHYPPPIGPGVLIGTGASGPTRETAWDDHRRRHGVLPQAVRLELEGYELATEFGKDDGKDDDREDAPDGGTAVVRRNVDAGPSDNRVIGAVAGSPAQEARKKALAEVRRKRALEVIEKNPPRPKRGPGQTAPVSETVKEPEAVITEPIKSTPKGSKGKGGKTTRKRAP